MSFIEEISRKDAEGDLKRLFDQMFENYGGRLPPVMRCMSLSPETVAAVHRLGRAISFGGSTLGRKREEAIATYISTHNNCHY